MCWDGPAQVAQPPARYADSGWLHASTGTGCILGQEACLGRASCVASVIVHVSYEAISRGTVVVMIVNEISPVLTCPIRHYWLTGILTSGWHW